MSLSPRLTWSVTIAYWLGIFTLTHIPVDKLPPVPVSDKIEHMTAYGILGILLFASLRASRWRPVPAAGLVVLIGMVYGAIDELLQIPVNRYADIHDWYADVAGAALAALICLIVETFSARRRGSGGL